MSKKLITPEEEEGPEEVCIIDTLVEEHCNQNMQDKLNESLGDLEEGLPEPSDVLATLQGWRRREEILPLFNKEEAQEAAKEETPKLNLKPLPMECKKAIGWQISDLKGISPLVCTHHIYMEEEAKPIRQPQRRLNPHLQEVVRAEVLKLLQAGEDHFHMSIWNICLQKNAFWFMQCTCNIPKMYASIFSDMVERIMEVFMDDITIYGGTFEECLVNLEAVLNRCIEKDLVLNWEKCHFMVHQGIVLGHIISEKGIEVDKAKVELIVKLPSPTTVKGVRQFLGHAGFYRSNFDNAPIVRAPNWQLPFEVMCDASDFAIGAVLGQREDGSPM
ncbi:Retrovirus-related Pol polyprotein from transposon 17.6 [Vitis vinifera]|uniref:Retrovirus-related Pol polyprotein from transposon 17.6 n=1 Tax=Vitis vinifera TaxID=29760 RepID=A0A438C596_VITVI|nr:Retrovirus-related Pol polyprotein from transposon 17.6 [Vitis vinifera]